MKNGMNKELAREALNTWNETLNLLKEKPCQISGRDLLVEWVRIHEKNCLCEFCERELATFRKELDRLVDELEPIHSDRLAKCLEHWDRRFIKSQPTIAVIASK